MWVWQSWINKCVSTLPCVTQVNNSNLTTARYACVTDLMLNTHVEHTLKHLLQYHYRLWGQCWKCCQQFKCSQTSVLHVFMMFSPQLSVNGCLLLIRNMQCWYPRGDWTTWKGHHRTNSPRHNLESPVKRMWMFLDMSYKKRCETYLKVFQGELQHVSEDIAEDLRLFLHQHSLIFQRLDHLWFYLQNINETNP